jgi:hypothetical protein
VRPDSIRRDRTPDQTHDIYLISTHDNVTRAYPVMMAITRDPITNLRRFYGYFRDPLFVFQMGKVGSNTLMTTLETHYRTYHLHLLADFASKYEPYRAGRKHRGAEYFDIITASREPLSWRISAFFQNLVNGHLRLITFESKEAALQAGMDELIARFRAWDDAVQAWGHGMCDATEWFDRHFEPATGIRIYDHAFDPERGWQIIREGKWRVLVLRFEDMNKNHLDAMNEFVVGRYGESSRLHSLRAENVSSQKWYADLMKEFKQKIKFSDAEIEEAYCSPYVRYFYTDQELANMRSKWQAASV